MPNCHYLLGGPFPRSNPHQFRPSWPVFRDPFQKKHANLPLFSQFTTLLEQQRSWMEKDWPNRTSKRGGFRVYNKCKMDLVGLAIIILDYSHLLLMQCDRRLRLPFLGWGCDINTWTNAGVTTSVHPGLPSKVSLPSLKRLPSCSLLTATTITVLPVLILLLVKFVLKSYEVSTI